MRRALCTLLLMGAVLPTWSQGKSQPIIDHVCIFEVENLRKYDISYEASGYCSEAEARTSEGDEMRRRRAFLQRERLGAGQKKLIPTSCYCTWVRWCQLEPATSLSCHIVNVDTHGIGVRLTLE